MLSWYQVQRLQEAKHRELQSEAARERLATTALAGKAGGARGADVPLLRLSVAAMAVMLFRAL